MRSTLCFMSRPFPNMAPLPPCWCSSYSLPRDGGSQLCSGCSAALVTPPNTAESSDGAKCLCAENLYNVAALLDSSAGYVFIDSSQLMGVWKDKYYLQCIFFFFITITSLLQTWLSMYFSLWWFLRWFSRTSVGSTSLFTVPLILASPHSFF